jgi:hypothetical protein
MSISFGAAAAAALLALVFTGLLVHRCARTPRLDIAAAACAALGLTVALGAQAVGYRQGFTPITFRAVQLGAQLLAPMALAWALAEMTGKSVGARFAARLALGGMTMVGAVILASDPLSPVAFTSSWPAASVYYQLIPKGVLELVTAVTAVTAVLALIVAAVRARRYPGWRGLLLAAAAAAAAIGATDGLRAPLPAKSGYVAVCLAAAALAWFAGARASRVRLDVLRLGAAGWDADNGEFAQYNEDTGEYGPYPGGPGYPAAEPGAAGHAVQDEGDTSYTGWFRDDTGEFHAVGSESDLAGWFRDDTGGFGPDMADTGTGIYHAGAADPAGIHQAGAAEPGRGEPGAAANGHGAGYETEDMLPAATGFPGTAGGAAGEEQHAQFYGQIAIYTLADGRAEEFDQLAQRVVEKVKGEPGTLAYVMHGVP